MLLSIMLLCVGLLPLPSIRTVHAATPAPLVGYATYPDKGSYSGGGVPEGVEAAQGFGTETDLRNVLTKILNAVFLFLGAVAVLVIVIAGIYILIGGGNDETRQKAYKMILYAIVGLLLIIFAGVIVRFATTVL